MKKKQELDNQKNFLLFFILHIYYTRMKKFILANYENFILRFTTSKEMKEKSAIINLVSIQMGDKVRGSKRNAERTVTVILNIKW